ncbi:MAG: hypothetical protein ACJA1R_002924, partial [Flavobacteriales bacterium]
FWFFVVAPVRGFVVELNEVTQVWRDANDLEREITNTSPFVAPTNGDMTQPQVDSFVAIQRAIVAAGAADNNGFRAQLEAWDQQMDGQELSFMAAREQISRIPAVLEGLGSTYIALKRVQIDALNGAGMSLEEYRWLRTIFYKGLGYDIVPAEVSEFSARAQELAESGVSSDTNVELNLDRIKGGVTPTTDRGSEANRALVQPYAEEAGTWVAHAPFL